MVQPRVCCCFSWPWIDFRNLPLHHVPLLFDMGLLRCKKMNRCCWTNRNHHDARFQKGLRICYVLLPNLFRCPNALLVTFFLTEWILTIPLRLSGHHRFASQAG